MQKSVGVEWYWRAYDPAPTHPQQTQLFKMYALMIYNFRVLSDCTVLNPSRTQQQMKKVSFPRVPPNFNLFEPPFLCQKPGCDDKFQSSYSSFMYRVLPSYHSTNPTNSSQATHPSCIGFCHLIIPPIRKFQSSHSSFLYRVLPSYHSTNLTNSSQVTRPSCIGFCHLIIPPILTCHLSIL